MTFRKIKQIEGTIPTVKPQIKSTDEQFIQQWGVSKDIYHLILNTIRGPARLHNASWWKVKSATADTAMIEVGNDESDEGQSVVPCDLQTGQISKKVLEHDQLEIIRKLATALNQ